MKLSETGQPDNDKVLAKIEKKINKEYTIANKEMEKKLKNYMKKFEAKDKEKKKLVKSGQLSQEDYIKWRQGKIVVGKQWESMCQVLAEDLDNSRIIAQHIVSDDLPTVYANGVNYATYQIEKQGHVNTNFTLYNHDAVEILVSENPKLYPDPTMGSETWKKLKSKEVQKWSKAKINSSITQAILQGEAINAVAKRLRKVTDMDYKASIRNARTMVGSAQNAGHQRSYERAEKMGVNLVKVWVSTIDMRTRHTHAVMDGESVAVKEKFSNGLLYPKDPNGAPSEIYNCRCREISQVKGWEKTPGSLLSGEIPKAGNMTYDEWKQWHRDALDGKYKKVAKGKKVDDVFAKVGSRSYHDIISEMEKLGIDTDDLSDAIFDEVFDKDISMKDYFEGVVNGKFENEKVRTALKDIFAEADRAEEEAKKLAKYKEVAKARGGSYPRTQAYLDNLYDVASAKAENERALQLIEKNRKEIATKFGVSEKEAGELLDNGIAKIIEDSEMTIAIDADRFAKVLDDGYFKNQFETQSSGGALNFDGRKKCEFKEFNVPKGAEILDADRPVYGALQPKFDPDDATTVFYYQSLGGASYGDGIKVALDKEKVINNATMTIGDSLNRQYSIFGTEMSAPKFTGTGSPRELESIASVGNAEISGTEGIKKMHGEYYEFQLHGKEAHSIDVIKEVLIDAEQCTASWHVRSKSAVIQKCNEKGIPWRLYGDKDAVARAEAALGLT